MYPTDTGSGESICTICCRPPAESKEGEADDAGEGDQKLQEEGDQGEEDTAKLEEEEGDEEEDGAEDEGEEGDEDDE